MRYDPYRYMLLIVVLYQRSVPLFLYGFLFFNNLIILLLVTWYLDLSVQGVEIPWTTDIISWKRYLWLVALMRHKWNWRFFGRPAWEGLQ